MSCLTYSRFGGFQLPQDGIQLPPLSLEGLLLTKQGARPKDQMDAALLSQALAEIKSRKK
jgi:hypothetical protein